MLGASYDWVDIKQRTSDGIAFVFPLIRVWSTGGFARETFVN